MSTAIEGKEKLSFSGKVSRLKVRLRNAEWRRYGLILLVGKALGVAAVIAMVTMGPRVVASAWETVSGTAVHAQTASAPDPYLSIKPGDLINPINTGWVLLGAFLVF